MKIVTAIDSFKGSMTSMEAGQAAAEGIHRVDVDAEVIVRPLADGGEGRLRRLGHTDPSAMPKRARARPACR